MSSIKEYVRQLHAVYRNSLHEDSPVADPPDGNRIRLPLHKHQKTVLAKMSALEAASTTGNFVENETIFSNYGILGDAVGAGKSLMILSHIARLDAGEAPHPTATQTVHSHSSAPFFSIRTTKHTDLSECGNLIIVPHTLFRQWSDYIKKQTNLEAFCVGRATDVNADTFLAKVQKAPVVLVSNTLLKLFVPEMNDRGLRWKRVFVDEADTIHMPGMTASRFPVARFYWFITASWINLLFPNMCLYLDKNYINTQILTNATYAHMHPHFRSFTNTNNYYAYVTHHVKSWSLLRDLISVSHPLRSYQVIKCTDEFIQHSIQLPPLHRSVIWCQAPVSHRVVQGIVTNSIQQMLHAGDTTAALEQLGVKGQTSKELIDAVTKSLRTDLDNLQKTYDFRASLTYHTPRAKEEALAAWADKIAKKKESIKSLEERVANLASEMCPICYDDPVEPLVTPCCSHVFCGACILLSMARNPECPLCRAKISPKACTKLLRADASGNTIVDAGAAAGNPAELEKKPQALLRLLRENPNGRFLIFSRYDNPFDTIETAIEGMGLVVKQLKGNKDAIASTLKAFDSGAIRCLLLNSRFAGSGLNIIGATHVVLLHAMTHEEEKQILGRAYRMGRKGPLHFVKLLNKEEESYTEAAEATAAAPAGTD
jgi:SNF2 family DNA or RNA helicase